MTHPEQEISPERLAQTEIYETGLQIVALMHEARLHPRVIPPYILQQHGFEPNMLIELDTSEAITEHKDSLGYPLGAPMLEITLLTLMRPLESFPEPPENVIDKATGYFREPNYVASIRKISVWPPEVEHEMEATLEDPWPREPGKAEADETDEERPEQGLERLRQWIDSVNLQGELGLRDVGLAERLQLGAALSELLATMESYVTEATFSERATQSALRGLRLQSHRVVERLPLHMPKGMEWGVAGIFRATMDEADYTGAAPSRETKLGYNTLRRLAPDALRRLGAVGPISLRLAYQHDVIYRGSVSHDRSEEKIRLEFPIIAGDGEGRRVIRISGHASLLFARVVDFTDNTEDEEDFLIRHLTETECAALVELLTAVGDVRTSFVRRRLLGMASLWAKWRHREA